MEKLITALRDQGIYISFVNENLKINFDGDSVPESVLAELKLHKEELITYLKQISRNSTKNDIPILNTNQKKYSVSSAQKRLWIVSQIPEASVAYNMPFSFSLPKEFKDKQILEKSIMYVVNRHESLRTVFKMEEDEEIYQYISSIEDLNLKIDYQDYKKDSKGEQKLLEYIQKDTLIPFDLSVGPLFRICISELNDNTLNLYCNLHHIITDEWSMEVLKKDIFQSYNAFENNDIPQLQELRIQYKDYAAWQLNYLKSEELSESELFWKDQLKGELQILELPTKKIRPKSKTHNGKRLQTFLDKSSTNTIKKLSKEYGGSLFTMLLASFKVLFYKYSGQKDIIIGSPTAGRSNADLENQIGFFLNTLVLRNELNPEMLFKDFYFLVKTNLLNAISHQDYPFDKLLESIEIKRDLSRNVLFDVLLDYHQSIGMDIADDLAQEIKDAGVKPVKYDLEFHFNEFENNISLVVDYNTDVYEEVIICQFIDHYKAFMKALEQNFDVPIKNVQYLQGEEREELINGFNATEKNFGSNKTILDLIGIQVSKFPDKIAVEDDLDSYTYREIEDQSNAFAKCLLKNYSLRKGDHVGIKMNNSKELLVAILGILKARCVFVPIDIKFTTEREQCILEDANLKLLVTTTDYMFDYVEHDLALFSIDVEFSPEEFDNEDALITPLQEDLAYILYTSGSTGKPKGVMIAHSSLYNYISWGVENYLKKDLRNYNFGLFTSICFDLTITSLFLPLVSGGKLVVFDFLKDVDQNLKSYLNKDISCIKLTPAHIQLIAALQISKTTLELVIVGGDVLTRKEVNTIKEFNSNIKIFNEYGPTEATVGCVVKEINLSEPIRIGKPIANTEIYVLGEHMELNPQNVVGEIYIGGKGLSEGYINAPELTKEKFVVHPFKENELIYKSGDLGSWNNEGEIDYAGRKDQQVKIKGFRIELGEVEHHLHQQASIEQAVVLINEKEGVSYLEAYIVASKDLNVKDLRIFLSKRLPEYMIPSHFNQLEGIPLTVNGKVDRKALKNTFAQMSIDDQAFVDPSNDMERLIADIWSKELGIKKISVAANFFDLGGDSIRAIRVLSRMNKALNLQLEVVDIFEHNTIKALIENTTSKQKLFEGDLKTKVIRSVEEFNEKFQNDGTIEVVYPMSDIEIGMCYSYTLGLGKGIYHDQFVYPITIKSFSEKIFREALNLMVCKHDVLRASYDLTTYKKPIRIVHKNIECDLTFEDISMYDNAIQKKQIELYMQEERYNAAFDIGKPGVWKMKMYKLKEDEQFLVFQFHHAILDGWSRASMITELNNTYFELKKNKYYVPKPLTINYKNYVIDQECLKQSEEVAKFWNAYLSDYERFNCFSNTVEFEETFQIIENEKFEKLNLLCSQNHVTMRTVVHAAYLFAMLKLSYKNDLLTGTVTNGRPTEMQGDEIIGCFLNTTPLIIKNQGGSLLSFVRTVDQELKRLKRYENISLTTLNERYSKEIGKENPFFDTLFNYTDFHVYKEAFKNNEDTNKKSISINNFELTNTFLNVTASPVNGKMVLQWKRNRALVSGHTNEYLMSLHHSFIDALLQNINSDINAINFHTKDEIKCLQSYNNTKTSIPKGKTLIDLFREQVINTPDAIAVVFENKELTYGQLDALTNRLSNYLMASYEIDSESVVGIKLERNEWLIVSILAVLKSGAAYVPMDLNYPESRLDYIKNDSKYRLCIDKNELEKFSSVQNEYSEEFFEKEIDQHHLAYIIYTSGTTGNPKGVMIEHKSILDYILYIRAYYDMDDLERILLFSNATFDPSVEQIFVALISGHQLHVASKELLMNSRKLCDYLDEQLITHLHATPGFLDTIEFREFKALKRIISGAERCTSTLADKWRSTYDFYNKYGPTETTIAATIFKYEKKEKSREIIPIGKPVSNTKLYIVNQNGVLSPIGVEGELWISGSHVSRGYLNNPDLTAEKFIKDPFDKKEQLYKTGDIARWLPDGNLEYIGRTDDQVKISGYRIELKDIEYQLLTKKEINQAIVLTRENNAGKKEIVAYLVSEIEHSTVELRDYLLQLLPEYMIPSDFKQIKEIPLTTNGKVDRNKLRSLESSEITTGVSYEAPKDEMERELVTIWKSIFQKEKIGMNDDFFALGGNSLMAIKLLNAYQKSFEVKLSLSVIFTSGRIKDHKAPIQQGILENKEHFESLEF